MRQIIRRREIVADGWHYPGAEAGEVGESGGGLALTLSEFLQAAPDAEPRTLGLWLEPPDELEQLAPLLDRARLIVVNFPKNGEGRGFTQAQLLRQRYRYTGELRAAGAVRRDQLFFLARCGFDSFDLEHGEDLRAALAALDTFSVAYQPGSDPERQFAGQRFPPRMPTS